MQETHLDDGGAAQFCDVYHSWFNLIHSAHHSAPTSTAGVAFLLNKKFIDVQHVKIYSLVPGRALMLTIPWHKDRSLTILNIYAPNKPQERDALWTELWMKWKADSSLPFPCVVLGDWNFVEDGIDRLSGNVAPIPDSFWRLKSLLRLEDGWRATFPDDRQYTCIQRRTNPLTGYELVSRSRLDRIYVDRDHFDLCRGWRIDHTAVKTDHLLVAMQMVCRSEEKPGRGRFSLPIYLLKTRKFTKEIQRLAKNLKAEEARLTSQPRNSDENIQTAWAQFKRDTIEHARNLPTREENQ
ncbi:Endonuclease/exonuclease/phosphatase [Mycena capillaripes]|nr:Endonuclease/exonuclease/phosphatase [Mycena capillaripes]